MRRVIITVLAALLGLSVIGATATVGATNGRSWPSEDGYYDGHRYESVFHAAAWSQAKRYCEKRNAHLVTINSAGENEFVFELSEQSWLGASDKNAEGEWRWVTGEPFSYTNWAQGAPYPSRSEHYAAFGDEPEDEPGTWENRPNGRWKVDFVCEYE